MTFDFAGAVAQLKRPEWVDTPETVSKDGEAFLQSCLELNDRIAALENPTLENALAPYVDFYNINGFRMNQLAFYQYVSPNQEMRSVSTDISDKFLEQLIAQGLRVDLFKAFSKLDELAKTLDHETKKFLHETVRDFKRNGLDLDEAARDEVKKIGLEISKLQSQFLTNLNEDKAFLLFTEDELNGMPEEVVKEFEIVEENGVSKRKVTFKYPDYIPLMTYAKNQATRKAAYVARENNIGENADIIEKIVRLRYKLAKVLGYDTFSDFILETRMAKNRKTALDFLTDLKQRFLPVGKKDAEELIALKNVDLAAEGLPPQNELYFWDYLFYNEKLLSTKYLVDDNVVKEYFPLDSTIEGMFEVYETLFDIKFVRTATDEKTTWHPDVRLFAVFQDILKGKPVFKGWIYLDLHPRQGKYSHAANFGNGEGYVRADGTREPSITMLVCNFTKPTADKPSLLRHSEVVTLFHELGHGVHSLLAETRLSMLHTKVERDFVEAPSQMLENWCWSGPVLKKLSKHYKTGEPINDKLISQIVASKNVNGGLFNLRQLSFGLFDLRVHSLSTQEELDAFDMSKVWNQTRAEVTMNSSDGINTRGYSSFGHIAGGYESSYYGYLYSLVYATDMFYTLFKKDPMNVTNGLKYRDIILRRGGAYDSMDNLRDVLGREPNSEAFFQELFSGAEARL